MINIFEPSLGKKELKAIEEVFESNWIGRGSKTEKFENMLADKIRVSNDNIVTTTSCTEGTFQIFEFLNLPPQSEVILPSISFIGMGNVILRNNLKPVFCDVDVRTLNPTAEHIEDLINKNTKVVMLLHYGGVPCEMDKIVKLCKDNNIVLIEDNACSPFSTYKDRNTGTIGDFGVWSFDAMKILVTGDGGLIYSNNSQNMSTMKEQCYLGLMNSSGLSNSIDKKWWEFNISSPGRRSIINDITAAIGIEQLNRVDSFINKRKQIHDKYNREFKDLNWLKTPPNFPDYVKSSYYMYWIQLNDEKDRDKLAKYLKDNGIYTTFRYYPLHWVKYYNDNSILPNTEMGAKVTLCLPLHQSLTDKEINLIIKKIKEFLK